MFDVRAAMRIALRRAAVELTPGLKESALKHGWPPELAAKLRIRERNLTLVAEFQGSEKVVHDLELGTRLSSPRPAVHNYLNSVQVQQRTERAVLSSLHEVSAHVDTLFRRM